MKIDLTFDEWEFVVDTCDDAWEAFPDDSSEREILKKMNRQLREQMIERELE